MWQRLFLVPLAVLGVALPAQAGPFRKATKPDPAEQVPALLEALKAEKDEKARLNAASELRDYDGKVFPEIIPALIDILTNDPSSSVRAEAAESIGKVRPVSSKAGYALEQAIANDKSTSVRLSARTALLQYRIWGYIRGNSAEVALAQTSEPPLASTAGPKGSSSGSVIRPTPARDPARPAAVPFSSPSPPSPPSKPEVPQARGLFSRSKPPMAVVGTKGQSQEPPLAARVPPPAPSAAVRLDVPPPAPVVVTPEVLSPNPARPTPLLTSQPKPTKERPVVVIPAPTTPVPFPLVVPEIPTPVVPSLPPIVVPAAPMQLPTDLNKPATPPATGPDLGPPPK